MGSGETWVSLLSYGFIIEVSLLSYFKVSIEQLSLEVSYSECPYYYKVSLFSYFRALLFQSVHIIEVSLLSIS